MNPEFRPTRHIRPQYQTILAKAPIPVQEIGIKQTLELLEAIEAVALLVGQVLAGKFKIWKIWQLWKLWRDAKKAFSGIDAVPKELLQLNEEERAEVLAACGKIVQAFFIGYVSTKQEVKK